MPYGYSYLDAFWNRKKKLEIIKGASYREKIILSFFHNLIFISLYTTLFVIVLHLIFYGAIKSDIYILILIAVFSPVVTQNIIRKYLYIKYSYYKNICSKILGVLGSALALSFFLFLMINISLEISMSLVQIFKFFLIEYVGLILIGLMFFKSPIRKN